MIVNARAPRETQSAQPDDGCQCFYEGKVGALEEKAEIRRAHADGDDANDVGVLQGPELIGLVAKRANDLFSQLIAAPPPPPAS